MEIGAPFSGMTDVLEPNQPQTVYAANVTCRHGYFDAIPKAVPIPRTNQAGNYIPCELGFWSEAEAGKRLTVWLGKAKSPSPSAGHVILNVVVSGKRTETDLTEVYGEGVPDTAHYSFAEYRREVFFCGGHWVYRLNRDTLAVDVLTLAQNPDPHSVDIPYLAGRLCASRVEVHLDGLWFVIPRRVTMPTTLTLAVTDPNIADPSKIVAGGWDMHPSDVYCTDPQEPAAIQGGSKGSYWNMSMFGDGSPVATLMSWDHKLVVWTKESVYVVSGSGAEDMVADCEQKGAGCVAPASVALVRDTLFWQGRGGVYYWPKGGQIQMVPGTSWLWGTGRPAIQGLIAIADRTSTWSKPWTPVAYGQGANYADTHYVLTGNPGLLCIEAATLAASVIERGTLENPYSAVYTDTSADGATFRLVVVDGEYGAKTITPGTSNNNRAVGGAHQPTLLFRVPFVPTQPLAAKQIAARVSSTNCQGTYKVIALDDAVRLGSFGAASPPVKDDEYTGGTFDAPPGGNEECGIYGQGAEADPHATPPVLPWGTLYGGDPNQQNYPRWAPTGPLSFRAFVNAIGSDFLVWVKFSGSRSFSVERLALVVEETT
ncbi:MAG: hypothetical protein WC789_10650 [Lentisphaeria bacterium]